MEDSDFLPVLNLFNALGIIEKGIDKIYHYLLEHKKIENLKEVSQQFGLSLKRGYKICSVLNDLELVQIYDRPMKINLITPLLPLWQKIVNKRIEELQQQFQEEKQKCEESLDDFLKEYDLTEEPIQEPVEFLSFNINNFEDMYYSFMGDTTKIALGIRYENPLIPMLKKHIGKELPDNLREPLRQGITKLKDVVKDTEVEVVFNSEVLTNMLQSEEFSYLAERIKPFNLQFKKFEVHVTDEDFSNFSLTKDALIQPSFDPTNKLIGAYISRNSNIYNIFHEKFKELFGKGLELNQYVQDHGELPVENLSKTEAFVLCLL